MNEPRIRKNQTKGHKPKTVQPRIGDHFYDFIGTRRKLFSYSAGKRTEKREKTGDYTGGDVSSRRLHSEGERHHRRKMRGFNLSHRSCRAPTQLDSVLQDWRENIQERLLSYM
jgi:hypothetical protein